MRRFSRMRKAAHAGTLIRYGVAVGVRDTKALSLESPQASTSALRKPIIECEYPVEMAPALGRSRGTRC